MKCRICDSNNTTAFLSLGNQPHCNNFVKKECMDAGYIVEDKEESIIWNFVKRLYRSWRNK